MHRPVSSREKCIPSRPVVTIFNYRPVPSWQFLLTVPSRHQKQKVIVGYRPVPWRDFKPTVSSRPIQATIIFINLPSRAVSSSNKFSPNISKQYRPVPSRMSPATFSKYWNSLFYTSGEGGIFVWYRQCRNVASNSAWRGCTRPTGPMHSREGNSCFSLKWDNDWLGAWAHRVRCGSDRTIGGVWSMNKLMIYYWWLRIVLILRVSLVCDCRYRVVVVDQGG